jgi:hypothetical protein
MNRYVLGLMGLSMVGCIFPGNLGGDRDAAGGDAASDGSPTNGASDGSTSADGGVHYRLYVAMQGFPSGTGPSYHELCIDPSTSHVCASGGGDVTMGGFQEMFITDLLEAGASYDYDYWFDTSGFTQFGELNPQHYVHPFGPVTSDVHIVLTPADMFVAGQ